LRTIFDVAKGEKEIEEMEKEMASPDFWENLVRAKTISLQLKEKKQETETVRSLEGELRDLKELYELSRNDEDVIGEIEKKLKEFEKKLSKEEFGTFLSGKYDRGDAIVSLYPGAGGVDAQDWTRILVRMYTKYFEKKNFQFNILDESFGVEGGIKHVTGEVKGRYAYGYLKGEQGVHRLVRISPFSAQALRHTSFAYVEVMPKITKPEEEDLKVKPEDIEFAATRASGPGGQNVNRRETAVRIEHLATGIAVECSTERSQAQNREKALEILYSKLYQLKLQEHVKEMSDLKGKKVSIEWGNQIRSYVVHPYQMVKDHRTGVETSDAQGVLDGDLDEFIEAEVRRATSH
jgi:peptide chain release factor 2